MMGYRRDGDKVTLEMSLDDWERLLFMAGMAIGDAHRRSDMRAFYAELGVVNRINEGNPNFTPYEIPEEFREA